MTEPPTPSGPSLEESPEDADADVLNLDELAAELNTIEAALPRLDDGTYFADHEPSDQ